MAEVWVIDAVRTPRSIGKAGKGALAHMHSQELLAVALRSLRERVGFETVDVDDIMIGCGTQSGQQGYCLARMAALTAGYDDAASGMMVERFCGSGLTAFNLAAMAILSGFQDLVVAGGVEMMSYTSGLQRPPLLDADNVVLRAKRPQFSQGIAADIIANYEGFSRAEVDRYAAESHRRAAEAVRNGAFRSVVPVLDAAGNVVLDHEQLLRPGTTAEGLGQLPASFPPYMDRQVADDGTSQRSLVERAFPGIVIDHVHHAGNSSGVADGAAAVLLASPDYARAHGLKPRARVRSIAVAGDSPEFMLNAPVPAARKALAKAKMDIGDIDLFEVNEAFAAIPMKFQRDLDVDPALVNANGGAIALGHPIGATGAMLIGTILDELERRDQATGLITLCTGGGMAPATIIERI
jgi:acetyl-CoA C-acetyltransferase